MGKYILSIDQGTSSTKVLLFDEQGKVVCKSTEPLKSIFWGEGFVEQDPRGIYENVLTSVGNCVNTFMAAGGSVAEIEACGISNQRETFVVWDATGTPLHNAVVWQCKRSVGVCARLAGEGLEEMINAKTGLIIDPYFSGTKLIWLYENDQVIKMAVDQGQAYFGTVDTWLLFCLTKGARYQTDYTNASRTMFFNLHTLTWDMELLQAFGLSKLNLPEPKPSSYSFGETDFEGLTNVKIPISSMIGDSHAAAFGEGCFLPGSAKATLGTGCSILMNIGSQPRISGKGMITTICWSTATQVEYALEGVIVSCGATLEWLKNELCLFDDLSQTESFAASVADSNGVYVIPAFSGLGAPYWQMNRKASINGLTFGAGKSHIIRAALESIPYQIKDVITAMEEDTGIKLQELMVNGGITANGFVLQFLADLLNKEVANRGMPDVSALGAAYLAGLQCGLYRDLEQLSSLNSRAATNYPSKDLAAVSNAYKGWKAIIAG